MYVATNAACLSTHAALLHVCVCVCVSVCVGECVSGCVCVCVHHTATRCNTLQHSATRCNTLQHTATHCNTLQHTATHCNTLQGYHGRESGKHKGCSHHVGKVFLDSTQGEASDTHSWLTFIIVIHQSHSSKSPVYSFYILIWIASPHTTHHKTTHLNRELTFENFWCSWIARKARPLINMLQRQLSSLSVCCPFIDILSKCCPFFLVLLYVVLLYSFSAKAVCRVLLYILSWLFVLNE